MNDFYRTVSSALIDAIRSEIVRGKYPPGSHLRLEELAGNFHVSTMPIREALRALEHEGIVTSFPHRGTFVTHFTPAELADIYEIRATLEQVATRSAVPCLTPDTLARLQVTVDSWHEGVTDIAEMVRINTEFHTILYECSGRTQLCELITQLRYRTHHYLHAYIAQARLLVRAQEEHHDILVACRTGNADRAAELMYEHVWQVGQALIAHISGMRDLVYGEEL